MHKRFCNFLLVIALLALGSGCTGKFTDINKNPYDFTEADLKGDFQLMGAPITQAQLYLIHYNDPPTAQLQQNLNADIFSGYMMSPTPFEGNINNMNYGLLYIWNNYPWNEVYHWVMKPCVFAQEKSGDKYPDFYAWATIMKVEAMHRISDTYGPIIYSHFGDTNKENTFEYDSQRDVYYRFFHDLDTAINLLTNYVNAGNPQRFQAFDLVYKGDYTKWIKFANTLRLRLAIRINGADKDKARKEGEAALKHPLGLLQDAKENFAVDISPVTHPLNIMCYTWADLRMSAPMESILTGYNDPRLPRYFVHTDEGANVYRGIRNGIRISLKEQYTGYSKITMLDNKIQYMAAAEAWFLKAEASLNGWDGAGSTAYNYEKGVSTSFSQYALTTVNDYLQNDTSKPAPYVDPVNRDNNVPAGNKHLSTITIKWNEGASDEEKLERIITQKWIAMFPEGTEAWSEFRRTGYPKLFPVVINNSNNTINTEKFIRRLPFPQIEQVTNPKALLRAKKMLNGDDNGGTQLWWDTK